MGSTRQQVITPRQAQPAQPAQPRQRAQGLQLIGASAGSGKTYALTETVCDATDPTRPDALPVESLLGVTFTTRAADELTSRVRQRLLASGATREAHRLPLARLGTVHAVALQLIQQFALDTGLAPGVQVLADGKERNLKRLVERSLERAANTNLQQYSRAMEIDWNAATKRSEWLHRVYAVIDLARSNRLGPPELRESAARSVAELRALLPAPTTEKLDARLERALNAAVADLELAIKDGDSTKATGQCFERLKKVRSHLRAGQLQWSWWPIIATTSPAKRSLECVTTLQTVAGRLEEHPQFQADLLAFTHGVFETAAQTLEEYDAWKRRRGVVDYVDMLNLALDAVAEPEVQQELARELRLVVVDEFQDTSPVQLSLFVALHRLAQRSVWVGDRKQCIFEFAGADPRLMRQVLEWSAREGGTTRQLTDNYRSRPALVDFCSRLFVQALAPHGYSADQVAVNPKRPELAEHATLPPLGIWELAAKNNAEATEALANGVLALLAAPTETPVLDRAQGTVRPLRPGDVAILVRANQEATELAEALARRGVRAAIARPGLLATPEGTLLRAGLAYLWDPHDRAARATLEALHDWEGVGPEAWLVRAVEAATRESAARKASEARDADAATTSEHQERRRWERALDQRRAQLSSWSPSEAILAALTALEATTLCSRWPEPAQRLANLDALRALGSEYEAVCAEEECACTLIGLLAYFDTASETLFDGTDYVASDEQASAEDPEAVVLMTYHRSKGLEWPVVVLTSLDKGPQDDAFGVHLESDQAEFDPEAPLAGRWIRYLPRPFSGRKHGVPLVETAAASPYGKQAERREREERARLLYVGMTRARDHLVFATRGAHCWLDELADTKGKPLLRLTETGVALKGVSVPYPVRHREFEPAPVSPGDRAPAPLTTFAASAAAAPNPAPPFRVVPSSAAEVWPDVPTPTLNHILRLGPPLSLRRTRETEWGAFGTALHGFLACDVPGLADTLRRARVERLLAPLGSPPPLSVEDALLVSDRLRECVERQLPGAVWHREVPITSIVPTANGPRRINGTIDLLLETSEALILVDHKSRPDPTESRLLSAAQEFAPQLGAYVSALAVAHRKPVTECWLHFPVAGVLVMGSCKR